MERGPRRAGRAFFVSAVSAAVAFASALQLLGEVQIVHIVTLFFVGFGAGAGLVQRERS